MARSSLLKNTFLVGALTSLSRVLGLVREMLQSRLIGAGMEQSSFTLAFAIPNMARKLFGEGALTAAFVPVFRGEVETAGLEKAARLARAVMTMVMLVLAAAVALSLAGLIGTLALADDLSERMRLTLSLVAILIPYMLAICGSAFGMGILNALGRFKASGFMPSLLNLVWIAALATLAFFPSMSVATRVRCISVAILAAGFAQLAFMFRCMAKAGVVPYPTFRNWGAGKVRLVWRNLAIAAFGAGAIQVNYALDQILAQLASPWAAGVIGYAERLMDLPLGVIGVAFGTVLLPTLAGFFARGDRDEARKALVQSVSTILFLMLPAAAGLAVLAPEVTRVIYESGKFDAIATMRVARALAVYAIGLGFFGVQKTLIPWFQAQNDMKTPLKVSVNTVFINAALNLVAVATLPVEWRHVGLAVSTVFCAAVGCALLVRAAHRRGERLGLADARLSGAKSLAAALLMAFALHLLKPLAAPLPPTLGLAALVTAGIAIYGLFAALFMRQQLRALAHRRRHKKTQPGK